MSQKVQKQKLVKIGVWLQEFVLMCVCLYYLLYRVHPVLIYNFQSPVFLMDGSFFYDALKIPGGCMDWLGSLLMQTWFTDVSGAILLTIGLWLIAYLTRKWMELFSTNQTIHSFHFVPVVLFAILYGQYDYHLSITLAWITNLLAVNLVLRSNPKRLLSMFVLYAFVGGLLFWITGGAFFIFVVLVFLSGILLKKNIISETVALLLAALLPYVASKFVFLVPVTQSYLHNLISENQINYWYIEYSIPGFFFIAFGVILMSKISSVKAVFTKIIRKIKAETLSFEWRMAIGTVFLLFAGQWLVQETNNNDVRWVLEIDRAIKEQRWYDALTSVMQSPKMNPCIISRTNLALFHTGVMLDRLFYCPQMYGSNGLFMDFQWCSYWPEDASDVYWDLGLINESLHWAHEAMEQKGATPTLLERCGLIYLVKGNYEAAKPFFLNLKKIPFQKNLADHLLTLSNDSLQAAHDSVIYLERSKMISDEAIVSIRITIPEKLEMLLKKNPHNKMAFDYFAAYCLMSNDLQRLLPQLLRGRNFAYKKIPLHCSGSIAYGCC